MLGAILSLTGVKLPEAFSSSPLDPEPPQSEVRIPSDVDHEDETKLADRVAVEDLPPRPSTDHDPWGNLPVGHEGARQLYESEAPPNPYVPPPPPTPWNLNRSELTPPQDVITPISQPTVSYSNPHRATPEEKAAAAPELYTNLGKTRPLDQYPPDQQTVIVGPPERKLGFWQRTWNKLLGRT